MTVLRFRLLVLLAVLVQVILWVFPWGSLYGEVSLAAFAYQGADALLSESVRTYIAYGILAFYAVSYAGMYFLRSWARPLFLATALGGSVLSLPSGLAVQGAYESSLGYLLTLADGALLAIVYFSSVSQKFR